MTTLPLIDTHAHLNSETFDGSLSEVVERAKEAGLVAVNVIGIDLKTSRRACELARMYPNYLFATVGIQPNCVSEAHAGDFEEIKKLVQEADVCAIGETGLDCYWKDTPIEQQQRYFDLHMQLCRDSGLPMVIHMRESGDLITEQLQRQEYVPPGVMHSFTGDERLAEACLGFGLHISFAGMVTFKKSDDLRRVAAMVPEEKLLIETDSPYLSPEPLRGKRPNEPARVIHTLKSLAELRKVSPEHLAAVTTANAKRLFKFDHCDLV